MKRSENVSDRVSCLLSDYHSPVRTRIGALRPRFDAYKQGVALEHKRKEQMRARWHLMKMEVGHRKANESKLAEADSATVDVGVMVYPSGEDCSLQRTRMELSDDIFTEYFPIDVPVYVIEYE